jgi:hypothetical protein
MTKLKQALVALVVTLPLLGGLYWTLERQETGTFQRHVVGEP